MWNKRKNVRGVCVGSIIHRRNREKKTLFFVSKVLHKNRSGDVLNTFTEGCFVAGVFCLVSAVEKSKVGRNALYDSMAHNHQTTSL